MTEGGPHPSTVDAAKGDVCAVALPAMISAGEAVQLRNSLLAALDQSTPVVLEGEHVVELSVQGLQVLLAFVQQATATDHPWSLHAPSEELVAALERYGLFARLMSWPVTG